MTTKSEKKSPVLGQEIIVKDSPTHQGGVFYVRSLSRPAGTPFQNVAGLGANALLACEAGAGGEYATYKQTVGSLLAQIDRGSAVLGKKIHKYAVSTGAAVRDACASRYSVIMRVGSDPEVLVVDKEGKCVPAYTFLPSKAVVGDEQPYWDGFQAEFSTKSASCLAYHVDSIQAGLCNLIKNIPAGAGVCASPVVEVTMDELMENPKFAQFGCTPSKNAYGEQAPIPEGTEVLVRMAGGHIHLGLTPQAKKEDLDAMVRGMDKLVGVLSVALFDGMDDPRRRLYYGRAGEYRTPAHGLEYRVLSNVWLCHPVITHLMFELTRNSATVAALVPQVISIDDEEARWCINSSNAAMARSLIDRNKEAFKALITASCAGRDKQVWRMIESGVKPFIPETSTLQTRWRMKGHAERSWELHSESEGCTLTKWSGELLT